MAPTSQPTPTNANKMGRRAAPTPTTSTPPLHRRKESMRAPQPEAPSMTASDDAADVTMTPARRAAEQAVDELPGVVSHGSSDRQDAFESARKKFAMYGKQNAHVSHYSPDQRQAMLERERQRASKRKGSSSAAGPSPARRAVNWDDEDTVNAVVLKNTLLLQENGELAAQVDEIEYHLDGIVATNTKGIGADSEKGYAMAQSVVSLTRLLQEEQVQAVMKVASHSRQLYARLRGVVMMLETTSHRMLTLAIAVLAYTLTHSADADEFFQEPVIDAVVACLEKEAKRLGVDGRAGQPGQQLNGDGASAADAKTPLKKSALKRKKSTGRLRRVLSAVDDTAFGMGQDEEATKADTSRSQALRDEKIQADLRGLLRGHDVFTVDGAVQLSLADLLCMILNNILQIGGAATAASNGESSDRSIVKPTQVRRLHQRQDQAGTMFATILQRKKQLMRNRGLDVLLTLLANRIDGLHGDLDSDLLQASVSLDLASAFQRVRTMLRVLDQASFLARDVQVHMSKDPVIFRTTLKLIEALSRLAWSRKSRKKWQSDPGFMHLVVDVLLAALRVLINLSHQNEDANRHIAELEGMRVLFFAFCRLWGSAELEHGALKLDQESRDGEDKVVYDALLLILSAITNCVEYSEENRALLSKIDLSKATLDGLEAFRASSVCSLLAAFFVSKVESYVHLIEMSESQRGLEEEAWVPEDVILGGCTSLLLGCLMKDSSYNSAIILGALPDGSPRLLLRALSAFVALHSQIGALTPEVGKSVLEVEQVLKSFSFDGDETMSSSPTAHGPRNRLLGGEASNSSTISRRSPLTASHTNEPNNMEATLTIKVTLTPQRRKTREADVEEIGDDGDENMQDSQPSQVSQHSVRSPPPSAFKLQPFKRICSAVDDSDDPASDIDPSPVKKKRSLPTPKSQSKAGKNKMVVSATVTMTPIRRVAEDSASKVPTDDQGAKTPTQRRLKRTRQLVSDLEAEFMKIGTQSSSEINVSSTATSSEDTGEGMDFSQDFSTSVFQDLKVRRAKATPKKTPRRLASTTPASSTATTVRTRWETPPMTQKRKTKPSTPKAAKKAPAKKASAKSTVSDSSVFDFPG